MITYYVTIIIIVFLSWLAESTTIGEKGINKRLGGDQPKYNNVFVFCVAAILICVSGFRWWVGTDYGGYARAYSIRATLAWDSIFSFNEPGLNIIAKVASIIYNDYVTMFFIAAVITIGLSVITISKYSDMFTYSILLYIFMGCWHSSFNAVRQWLACAILFAGYRLMIERKFWRYLLVVLVASAFHTTALIMLFVYFLAMKKISIINIAFVLVGTIVMLFSYDFVFNVIGLYKGHELEMAEYMTNSVNIFRVLVTYAPLVLCLFFTRKKVLTTEETFYINILIVNAALMTATLNSAYLARIGIFTNIYSILAFPKLLKTENKRTTQFLKWGIVALYSVFWFIEVSGSRDLNNFRWIFNRPY